MTLLNGRIRAPPKRIGWIFVRVTMMALMAYPSLLFTIRHAAPRVEDHAKAGINAGNETCAYSEDVAPGEWIAPDRWRPRSSECEYEYYTDAEFGRCMSLKYRRIAFFGDSLLLNVFVEMTRRLERAGQGTLERRRPDFYLPGGRREFVFNGTSSSSSSSFARDDEDDVNATTATGVGDDDDDDRERRFVFWWTPSSFHADVRRYEKEFDALDGAVFGMAVWDMGTYFRGANAFRDRYSRILSDASGRGVPTFVFGLHKLWPERCVDPTGPCARCNTAGKERAFRAAVGHVVACGAPSSSSEVGGEGGASAVLVDMFGFTSTPEAMADGVDAVHYGRNTTSMEATHLANVLCRDDGFARRQRRDYGCRGDNGAVFDFDGLISTSETLPCV